MFNILRIFVCLLFLLNFTSCERDVSLDFRDVIIGEYNCMLATRTSSQSSFPVHDTTYLIIEVRKDFNSSNGIVAKGKYCYLDSSLHYTTYNLQAHTYYEIQFRNDSIFIQDNWSSPGTSIAKTYKGVKVN